LSFFFYATFRFVATHCYTPVILYVYFFKNNFLFFFLPVDRLYLYVYMCFFLSVFLFICNDMLSVLSMVWCNDIDLCMYVAVQQWSTKLLFLFLLFNIQIIETKTKEFISFLLNATSYFFFVSSLFFQFCFFQSTLQTSSFLHYRSHTQSVFVWKSFFFEILFCCYYIKEKLNQKKYYPSDSKEKNN